MAKRLDHNEIGGLDPSTFLRLYRELRQARTPMETAVSNYRTALKRLKDGGVDTFALNVLEKLVKVEEDQAGLHMRNLFRYAEWTNANVGLKQHDLFGGTDDQMPTAEATGMYAEQLAEENGFRSGKARERGDVNPHAPASAVHAAWSRGWNRGQAEEVMSTLSAKPPKQPTRRARNPASETRTKADDDEGDDGRHGDDDAASSLSGAAADLNESIDTSNVVPMGVPKRARMGTRPTATLKERKATMKAADNLHKDDVVSGQPAF